jgi:CRP-like cAMP-binding protein
MSELQESQTITAAQRQALITTLPCFSALSSKESEELAASMSEIVYQAGEPIVIEDNLVDSVCIIVSGKAEVTRQEKIKTKITHKVKTKKIPLAIMGPGDAIGLNDTGFFSTTGRRMAQTWLVDQIH